MADNWHLCQI